MTTRREEAPSVLTDFNKALRAFHLNHATLVASYPHMWIAIDKDGIVIAHDKERKKVISACRQKGLEKNRLAVNYLDPNPVSMIL